MVSGELEVGEPRLGWFVDGDPNTEDLAVMLRNTGSAIELTIPLKGVFGLRSPYGRWWSEGIEFGDDPDRVKYSYRPPRVLLMEDNHGAVALVGCRAARSSANFRVGQGVLVANFAVIGGRTLKYERINGLRTRIPALSEWTRFSQIKSSTENKNGRLSSLKVNVQTTEPIRLSRTSNLSMRSTWSYEKSRSEISVSESLEIETRVKRAKAWNEHLYLHEALLEILSIAAWQPFGFSAVSVLRDDDPERASDGTVIQERWAPVVTHRLPKHVDWTTSPNFLFPFDEVGTQGIRRWLTLRETYGRALDPFVRILRSTDKWAYPNVVQSGIALELLGYLIEITKNDGTNLKGQRQRLRYKDSLRTILNDMEVKPFNDIEDWIERADAVYMGMKHHDREHPDSLEVLNTFRQNLLVIRFWIGLQLGVSPSTLNELVERDPLASEFVAVN